MSQQTAANNTQDTVLNGVNVTKLGETVEAINGNTEIAKFQFRATNKWITGSHNRTWIKEFYGACQEDTTRTEAFVLENDEPPILLGEDKGANPAEYVLNALLACMTTTMVYKAAANGIKITEVESYVEGDLDLRGILELDEDVRSGYQSLRVSFKVKTEGSPEELEMLEQLCKASPVLDIVSNGVPVDIRVDGK